MNIRLARRREGVVSLTHTEIMLILATVILLLLLAKSVELDANKIELDTVKSELASAKSNLEESLQAVEALGDQTDQSAKEAKERKKQIDLAQEVKAILVREGIVEENSEPAQITAAISAMSSDNKRAQELEDAINETLFDAGIAKISLRASETSESVAAEAIKQLAENAAIGKAVRENLDNDLITAQQNSADASESVAAEVIKQLAENTEIVKTVRGALDDSKADAESIKQRIDEWTDAEQKIAELQENQLSDKDQLISDLRSKIGCVPCWLGSGEAGESRYYFAYDITYHYNADSFDIKPSKDWDKGVEIVNDALNGGLSDLKKHPEGIIDRDDFLRFGERIVSHKDQHHGEECSLMVTINKDQVDGNVIEFIREQVGFCPIYK